MFHTACSYNAPYQILTRIEQIGPYYTIANFTIFGRFLAFLGNSLPRIDLTASFQCHYILYINNQGWVIRTSETSHTRIIRNHIFAILGGTLCLHQPPSNHHELSPQPPVLYYASLVKTLSGVVLLLWDRRGRITRCQMPMPDARIPRFQQRCPPHPRALSEAESQRRCSSMQS